MSNLKTYLILFGGVLAISTAAIWVKLADAPASTMAFYRLFIAAVVLLPFLLLNKHCINELKSIQKRQVLQIAAAGFFLALHYVLWFESLNFTSTASSTVIVCLQPLFSLAIERFIVKKRIPPTAMVGCIIALSGCFIIGFGDFQIGGKSLLGDILAFIAAGIIALYFFIGENIRKEMSAITYSTTCYFVSAIILVVYILIKKDPFVGYGQITWIAFFGIALIATVGGQFVFNLLLKKLPASAVTMSIVGEPIGTCILAYLILHETITFQQFVGIVVILLGIMIFFLLPNRKKMKQTMPT